MRCAWVGEAIGIPCLSGTIVIIIVIIIIIITIIIIIIICE